MNYFVMKFRIPQFICDQLLGLHVKFLKLIERMHNLGIVLELISIYLSRGYLLDNIQNFASHWQGFAWDSFALGALKLQLQYFAVNTPEFERMFFEYDALAFMPEGELKLRVGYLLEEAMNHVKSIDSDLTMVNFEFLYSQLDIVADIV